MENESNQLRTFLLPLMAQGHMIPVMDMAKVFATRRAKVTIIATPLYATLFSKQIERINQLGMAFEVQTVKFPSSEVGLPEGWENPEAIIRSQNQAELLGKFWKAVSLLREPMSRILEEHRPDSIVGDLFFPWAADVAARLEIPRLVFSGTSFFATCTGGVIGLYQPHKRVSSDSETFLVPHLPGEIKLTRTQLPEFLRREVETEFSVLVREAVESEQKSYGSIFNSFYELEKDYADYCRNVLVRKAWHIGPVSLCNRDTIDKALRGKEVSISRHECLRWLDSKKTDSVVYLCFGSLTKLSSQQLMKIAKGLWNSILEGVCAGVPMVTWPMFAEQFYNEKLVTQMLGIGIDIGSKQFTNFGIGADVVSGDDIEKAERRVMTGEEAEEMRRRAKVLGGVARKAVWEGGSSDSDLTSLIEELRQQKAARKSK